MMAGPRVLVNLGCGSNFHPAWRNLDLVPQSSEVEQADLANGIPFGNDEVDVVYHSHVLEHLTEADGQKFLSECYRVLKPGGILRIAVPDLEQIAKYYLATLDKAWIDPTEVAQANHRWMQLELLDQILRKESGGEMGRYMINPEIPNRSFVDERLGNEVSNAKSESNESVKKPGFWSKLQTKLKRKLIRLLFGKELLKQIDVAEFRSSGEIHQWMYDRVSLRNLLIEKGFRDFRVCEEGDSSIEGFADYELDFKNEKAVKPDSLFVEAVKPALSSKAAA